MWCSILLFRTGISSITKKLSSVSWHSSKRLRLHTSDGYNTANSIFENLISNAIHIRIEKKCSNVTVIISYSWSVTSLPVASANCRHSILFAWAWTHITNVYTVHICTLTEFHTKYGGNWWMPRGASSSRRERKKRWVFKCWFVIFFCLSLLLCSLGAKWISMSKKMQR